MLLYVQGLVRMDVLTRFYYRITSAAQSIADVCWFVIKKPMLALYGGRGVVKYKYYHYFDVILLRNIHFVIHSAHSSCILATFKKKFGKMFFLPLKQIRHKNK